MSTSSRIAEILLQLGAVTLRPSKPFTWASGIQSPIYCDNRLILSEPKSRDIVIRAFEKLIRDKKLKFDAIAGIATAGIPHAALLADRLKKPMLYVRASAKQHGKGNQIEGNVKEESRILVVEDLVSTGKSSLEAVKALRDAGHKVQHCLAIFTYGFPISQQAFQAAQCQLHTLTNLNDLVSVAVVQGKIKGKDMETIQKFAAGFS